MLTTTHRAGLGVCVCLVILAAGSVQAGTIEAWGWNQDGQCNVPQGDYIAMAGAVKSSVAIRSDGSLASWSIDWYGLDQAPTGNNYVAVTCGDYHAVALRSNNTVVAWGSNENFFGTKTTDQCVLPTGPNFKDIAAGAYFTLLLRMDGTIAGYGENTYNQCDAPAGTYKDIAAGNGFSLAIRTDGSLAAWGANHSGQCDVPGGNDFQTVTTGGTHALALRTDGSLVAWGDDNYGAVTNVPMGNDFIAIDAGGSNCIALRSDGTVEAWGFSGFGQNDVPAGKYSAIAAGTFHNMAIPVPEPATMGLLAFGGLAALIHRKR